MAITTYAGWVADGSPYRDCTPSIDIRDTLGKKYGLVVYSYPDLSHLKAAFPEDHAPYSRTPWPGSQPYPYGRAVDIMPDDDVCDWRALGEQIVADIDAKVPGTECIAYINYTTRTGRCVHVEYEPTKDVSPSGDTGHIHISFRTDYVTSHVMAGYDPVARLKGEDMTLTPVQAQQLAAATKRDEARVKGLATYDANWTTEATDKESSWEIKQLALIGQVLNAVNAVNAKVDALAAHTGLSPEELAAIEAAVHEGNAAAAKAAVADVLHAVADAAGPDPTP